MKFVNYHESVLTTTTKNDSLHQMSAGRPLSPMINETIEQKSPLSANILLVDNYFLLMINGKPYRNYLNFINRMDILNLYSRTRTHKCHAVPYHGRKNELYGR